MLPNVKGEGGEATEWIKHKHDCPRRESEEPGAGKAHRKGGGGTSTPEREDGRTAPLSEPVTE